MKLSKFISDQEEFKTVLNNLDATVLLKVFLVVVVLSEIGIYILLFLFTKHSNFSLRRLH